MAITPGRNPNSLLALILPSEFQANQFAVTEKGKEWPLYKFLRAPSAIEELKPYSTGQGGVLVWMDNGTLAYINNGGRFPPPTRFTKFFELHPGVCIRIHGDSDDAILETANFFGTLESFQKQIEISYKNNLDFDDARAEQLALIMDKNQTRKICFIGTKLNSALSAMIATRPYPVNLYLENASIDEDAFLKHFQGRTTPFGSLTSEKSLATSLLKTIFHQLNLFEHFLINRLPNDLILQLLSAPVKSVGFTVGEENKDLDLMAADILPKDIRIQTIYEAAFPTTFMLSFLRRVAQLGHLESLELSLREDDPIPVEAGMALLGLLGASKNLKSLRLPVSVNALDDQFIKDLFDVIENHGRLTVFSTSVYPTKLDPQFKWLKHLMQRNRRVHVTDNYGLDWKYDRELEKLYALNRFLHGSHMVTKEPLSIRTLVLVTARTYGAVNHFQRAATLLGDQADILCEILHEIDSANEAHDDSCLLKRDTDDDDDDDDDEGHPADPELGPRRKRQR